MSDMGRQILQAESCKKTFVPEDPCTILFGRADHGLKLRNIHLQYQAVHYQAVLVVPNLWRLVD